MMILWFFIEMKYRIFAGENVSVFAKLTDDICIQQNFLKIDLKNKF